MIGTTADILTLQRVEGGCPPAVVGRVLSQANIVLQHCIGSAHYAEVDALPTSDPIISGGTVAGEYFEGLAVAVSDLAFAMLAQESLVVTGFGTVKKIDEYSREADYFNECKAKEARFFECVRRLCRLKDWAFTRPPSSFYTQRYFV